MNNMGHMQLISLAISLVDAASDGKLTLDEVKECLGNDFPRANDVVDAIDDAMENGRITVFEVINIVTTLFS